MDLDTSNGKISKNVHDEGRRDNISWCIQCLIPPPCNKHNSRLNSWFLRSVATIIVLSVILAILLAVCIHGNGSNTSDEKTFPGDKVCITRSEHEALKKMEKSTKMYIPGTSVWKNTSDEKTFPGDKVCITRSEYEALKKMEKSTKMYIPGTNVWKNNTDSR